MMRQEQEQQLLFQKQQREEQFRMQQQQEEQLRIQQQQYMVRQKQIEGTPILKLAMVK